MHLLTLIETDRRHSSCLFFCSHFGSFHFLFKRARCFSRSRAFLVLSFPSVYNPELSFFFIFHGSCERRDKCADISSTCFSSNLGSPNGSLLDLEGTRFRACTKEEKSTKSTCNHRSFIQNAARLKITSRRLLRQWLPRRLRLQILKQIVGYLVWLASLLWKQMQLPRLGKILEQTRTWRWLHNHWVPRPLTQGHPMTIGIRDADLILFTILSEHARSTVLLQLPCEQHHTGITNWINNLWAIKNCAKSSLSATPLCTTPHWNCEMDQYSWERSNIPADNKPVTIHCKAGSVSARLVFETRTKCQDFVTRHEDDDIHFEIDSPFCSVKTTISVRRTKSLEPGGTAVCAIVEKVGRPQISASRIDRNGVGNLCSNLLLLEARNCSHLFHLI